MFQKFIIPHPLEKSQDQSFHNMSAPLAHDGPTWAEPGFLLPGFIRKIDRVVSPKTKPAPTPVLFGGPGTGIGNNGILLPGQFKTLNWSSPSVVDDNNDDNDSDTMPELESEPDSDSMSSRVSVFGSDIPTSYLSANNINDPPKLLCASGCCTPAETSEASEAPEASEDSDSDDYDSLPKLADTDSDVDDSESRGDYISTDNGTHTDHGTSSEMVINSNSEF